MPPIKRCPEHSPRFTLIVNEQKEREYREEQKRQAELTAFIKACEALYEKNRAHLERR